MNPLDSGLTIQASAAAGSAVTSTITGVETNVTTGVNTYKKLDQRQLATSAATPLYTVPGSTSTIVKQWILANTTGNSVAVLLYIGGAAAANQIASVPIPANGEAVLSDSGWKVYDSNGSLVTTVSVTLAGDVTGLTGATVVGRIQGVAVDTTPPTNGQVFQYVSASSKYIPFSYAGDVGGGPSASNVNAIKGIPVLAGTPAPGQTFNYFPSIASWAAVDQVYNIVAFGADPTGNADCSLAIYNAIISCGLQTGSTNQIITGAQVTTGVTFNITVPANSLSASGTFMAMTTRGLLGFTYTGGGTTTLAATTTWGVSGGTLLSGSIIGTASTTSIGGVVYSPAGFYIVNNEVTNSIPGVQFIGDGSNNNHDTGSWPYGGGSWWSYRGTAGGSALRCVPVSGSSGIQGGQVLGGIKVMDMNFDCSGTSGYGNGGYGVQMISCNGYHMENLYVFNALKSAYEFTTLGAAMLGEAEDCTRGTHINLKFRQLEAASTAANTSAAVVANAAATTNLNALSASTIVLPALTAAAWPTPGVAKVQAVDQLTGTVCWYLVTYTGLAASNLGLTGCTAVNQWYNQTNSTTLNAATPTSGNPKPNAVMFAGSKVEPAQGAFAEGFTWHGSATANACCSTFIQIQGTYFMGTALWSGNSDSMTIIRPMFNRTTAGTPTGLGVELHGSTLSGATGAAGSSRNQYFISGDPGLGGITIRGTDTLNYLQPAATNKWDYYELGNGAPVPVSGTNAHFIWSANGGLEVGMQNASLASATGAASATGVINGTQFPIPPQGIQIGTTFRWTIPMSKTAAGTALTIAVKFGTANTTADGSIATMTLTSSAAVDSGELVITLIVTSLGAAATALATSKMVDRVGTTTGFSTTAAPLQLVQMTMAAFNSGLTNPGPAFLGVYVTVNTSGVLTFLAPNTAEVLKDGNP